jgi:hypothetical protein
MAKEQSEKKHEKGKGPPSGAPQGEKKPKPKPAAEGGEKAKAEKAKGGEGKPEKGKDAAAAEKEKEKAPKAPPRPPADPRLKVLKKFYGKFLPRGPLRDRHKALMDRWNSGEDHGGVTVEELRSLFNDWKKSREKPARPVRVSG